MDIAIPEKKIVIEVNGNQHYDSDGSLKPYYQERHDLIENVGWNVMEVHYKDCYTRDRLEEILRCIVSSEGYATKDVCGLIRKKRCDKEICPKCGGKKYHSSEVCIKCKRVVIDREELERLYASGSSIEDICTLYGRSASTIRNLLKKYELFPHTRPKASPKKERKLVVSKCNRECQCGCEKDPYSESCLTCYRKNCGLKIQTNGLEKPTKEQLLKEIWEIPTTKVAKKYGVSDKAVEKWCKKYDIQKPPRGYWAKLKKSEENNTK